MEGEKIKQYKESIKATLSNLSKKEALAVIYILALEAKTELEQEASKTLHSHNEAIAMYEEFKSNIESINQSK